MYTDTTTYINSTYDTTLASESASSGELDQDAFLNLLITQLEWQDPLDPMDDTEMVAQLAEFSQLEELESMGESLESTLEMMAQQNYMTAASYIGTEVEAAGSSMSKNGDVTSTVTYSLSEDASSVYAHIINEDGEIVSSVDLGEQDSGDHAFQWDGLDADGNEADDGQYAIAFAATDAYDEDVYVSTSVSGTVAQVYVENGSTMLGLTDGRTVNINNVSKVVDTELLTGTDSETELDDAA